MSIKSTVENYTTSAMLRAGADAMSEFDDRFEGREDVVPYILIAMIEASPP